MLFCYSIIMETQNNTQSAEKNPQPEQTQQEQTEQNINYVPNVKIEDKIPPQTVYPKTNIRKKGEFIGGIVCFVIALLTFAFIAYTVIATLISSLAIIVLITIGFCAFVPCAICSIASVVLFSIATKSSCHKIKVASIVLLVLSAIIVASLIAILVWIVVAISTSSN